MSTVALILLSYLAIISQGLYSSQERLSYTGLESDKIVETINKNEPAVVMIKGYEHQKYGFSNYIVQSTEGTGFIVDSDDGTILTNKHVVENTNEEYKVITSNGVQYKVLNVYRDPGNDVAVVKIDPNEHENYALKSVPLGDSEELKRGEGIMTLSDSPGNIKPTSQTGNVLGLNTTIIAGDSQNRRNQERLFNVIQTNLALIPGNSGSPLFNEEGEVVGINTATSTEVDNVSFAIPINAAKTFMERIGEMN